MENKLEQISNSQKDSWNKFSPGWGKWDDLTMGFLGPYGEEMIKLIEPTANDVVLQHVHEPASVHVLSIANRTWPCMSPAQHALRRFPVDALEDMLRQFG